VISLPDVNVLVAAHDAEHVHHQPALAWLEQCEAFATTPMTEAGFVRVLMLPMVSAVTFKQAVAALRQLRNVAAWSFWPDDVTFVESRVETAGILGSKQVTDFHLIDLAARHGGRLVTFDAKLRGSLASRDRDLVEVLT